MKKKIVFISVLLVFAAAGILFGKKKNDDEKRLQFGFGIFVNTPTINEMIENRERNKAIMNGWDYSYPDTSDEEMDSIKNLSTNRQKAVLAENILSNMEYGIQFRLLWRLVIAEINISMIPSNNYYNGGIEFITNPMIGIRAPYFIMPYAMFGPSITVGFNNENYYSRLNDIGWCDAAKESLYASVGFNFKTGLDLKFKHFSMGLYYLYSAKSLNEFDYLYNEFIDQGYTVNQAMQEVIGAQSRFGISLVWYFDGVKKDKREEKE